MLFRFSDLCPIGCDNFMKLCTGECGRIEGYDYTLNYEGCGVHRIVPGGWMQCGDIIDASGNYSVAALGEGRIGDECFSVDFGAPEGGIVGYSSSKPHDNGSQFFITFGPCEWMQYNFEGIGRVIQGYPVLKAIESLKLVNQKPQIAVVINECGIEYKPK
jgi:peptidylprolyl isomerase